MSESKTELKKRKKALEKQSNLIDHAIGYFAHYGEPQNYRGIYKYLKKEKQRIVDVLKEIEEKLKRMRL